MKTCPFCKAQVHDEAIKCRHCQSMLLPTQLPEPKQSENDRVTYILDQDLVRFGKFAVAVLGVFLIVGSYSFGFKLESSLEKAQSAQEKSKTLQEQFTKSQDQLVKAQAELETQREKLAALRTQVEETATQAAQAGKQAQEAAKQAEDALTKSKTSIVVIEKNVEQSRTLLGSVGQAPPASGAFGQEQAGRLVEVKVLTAFRGILTTKQYSALEKAMKGHSEVRRAVYNAEGGTSLPGKLLRLEEQPATADALANQVYDNIGIVHEFFRTVFGRNINSDVHGPIVATVHYETKYNNAFWNGQQLVLGDGDGVVFKSGGFASLGAIAAELGHLVVQYSAGLEYQEQSGALNSHFSDLFSVMVEQWHKKQSVENASWLVGEEFLAPGIKGVALRSMKAPGTAYDDPRLGKDRQLADMKNFVPSGDVHLNSGIPNRAFYEVARLIGGFAWEKPGKIWYESLLRLKKPNSTFDDFAQTTYDVAGKLYGTGSSEQNAVKKGWQAVGISVGTV